MKIHNILAYILFFMLGFNIIIPILTRQDIIVSASGENWLTGWGYRRQINVSDKIDDYVSRIIISRSDNDTEDVNCSGYCNTNFSDIRICQSDGNSLLPFWMDNYTSNDNATIYFRNSFNESILFLYYNNSVASPASNGTNTFDVFDDFESYSIDEDPNGQNGWITVQGGGHVKVVANPSGTGQVLELYDSDANCEAGNNISSFEFEDVRIGNNIRFDGHGGTYYYSYYFDDANTVILSYTRGFEGDKDFEWWDGNSYENFISSLSIEDLVWYDFIDYVVTTGTDNFTVEVNTSRLYYGGFRPTGINNYIDRKEYKQPRETYKYWIDDFWVANFTSGTEPSFEFSSETPEDSCPTSLVMTNLPYWQHNIDSLTYNASYNGDLPDEISLWYRWSTDNIHWGNNSSYWNWNNDTVDTNDSNIDSVDDFGNETNFDYARGTTTDEQYMNIQENNTACGGEEILLVNAWTDDFGQPASNWTRVGSEPWIDAIDEPTNYIYSAVNGDEEGYFDFQDTTLAGDGIYTNITVNARCSGNDDISVYVDNGTGGGYVLVGTIDATLSYANYTYSLGILNATNVNDVSMYVKHIGVAKADNVYVDYACLNISQPTSPNYRIDFEYNWSNANTTEQVEQLCIFVGSITGTEDLYVDYWNTSLTPDDWTRVITIDSDMSWFNSTDINVSSNNFYIRFSDVTGTCDGIQGDWDIDCIFLQTYNDTDNPNPIGVNWSMWDDASNPDTTNSSWGWIFDFPNETGYYEFYSIANLSGCPNETAPSSWDARNHVNYSSGLPLRINPSGNETPTNESFFFIQSPQPTCEVFIESLNGTSSTVDWYTSDDGVSWNWVQQNSSVLNETVTYDYTSANDWNMSCYWQVYANDTFNNISRYFVFYVNGWFPFTALYLNGTDNIKSVGGDDGTLNQTLPFDYVPNKTADSLVDIYCSSDVSLQFNDSITLNNSAQFGINNIYHHIWLADNSTGMGDTDYTFGYNTTYPTPMTDLETKWTNTTDSITTLDGSIVFGDYLNLTTPYLWDIDESLANYNNVSDIYQNFTIHFQGTGIHTVSNRSMTSFIILNVPSNATLNSSYNDVDADGLSTWTELYVNYTNPFVADTDGDGVNDYWEVISNSDPNNFTDTNNRTWTNLFNYTSVTGGNQSQWTNLFNYSSVTGGNTSSWTSLFNYSSVTGGDISSWASLFNYSSVTGGDIVQWTEMFNYTSITGGNESVWTELFNYSSVTGGNNSIWVDLFNYTSVTGGDIASWSELFNYTSITGGNGSAWSNIFNYSSITGGNTSSWSELFNYTSVTGGDISSWNNLFNYSSVTGGNGSNQWSTIFNISATTGGNISQWYISFNISAVAGGNQSIWQNLFNISATTGGNVTVRTWQNLFNISATTGGNGSNQWNNIFNISATTGGNISAWYNQFNISSVTGGNGSDSWLNIFNISAITGGNGTNQWFNIFNTSFTTGGNGTVQWNNIFNISSVTGGNTGNWQILLHIFTTTGGNGSNQWNNIFNTTNIYGGNGTNLSWLDEYLENWGYIKEDDDVQIDIGIETYSIFLTLVLFMFFFFIGYTSKKRSGGAFMIFSGFALLSLEVITALYLSSFYLLVLITPFAIFIILLGIRKWLYPVEGEHTPSEGT